MGGPSPTPHGSRTRSAGRRPSTERVSTGHAIDAGGRPRGQTEVLRIGKKETLAREQPGLHHWWSRGESNPRPQAFTK